MKYKSAVWAALVITGLSVGVFFAFSVAVNLGLANVNDNAYVSVMQEINRRIQNPVFFAVFFGAVVALPLAAYGARRRGLQRAYKLWLLASIAYIVGCFGVTSAVNVPLNDSLAKVAVHSLSPAKLHSERVAYQTPWNQWHTVRTVSAVAALGLAAAASLATNAQPKRGSTK